MFERPSRKTGRGAARSFLADPISLLFVECSPTQLDVHLQPVLGGNERTRLANMDEAKQKIKKLLECGIFKLEVFEIDPHPIEQRADLRAFDGNGVEYLIEVKSKFTDQDFQRLLLKKGEAHREDLSGPTNVMSRKVREAADQLESTPSSREPFRLVAFATFQQDSHQREVDANQFRATLYGIVDLVVQQEKNSPVKSLPCFYFTYAAFRSHPEIDGAIILWGDQTQMCANPFGKKVEAFKGSCLIANILN